MSTKACAVCGAQFTRSPTDSTVNCPEHRGKRTAAPKPKKYPAIPCSQCGHVHTTLRCDRCGF